MNEVWKPITDFENLYEVSDSGRVRAISSGSIITPKLNNRGYLHVILWKNAQDKSFLVHRLVAKAFVPCGNSNMTVNHIDENRLNNRADNLEWCSLKENIHKYQENHPDKTGRPENMTPVAQFDMGGRVVKIWKSVAEIRRNLNYNAWSISQCCNGKRKTAYGYKWQYAT